MKRREFLLALGGGAAAAIAAAEPAAAEVGMHPPKYPALQAAAAHCVTTSSDCMRHCIGMLAMKDYSMTGCVNTAYQVGVAWIARIKSRSTIRISCFASLRQGSL